MTARTDELERIAHSYHLNDGVPDKFIEDALQEHCCTWLAGLVSPDDFVVELGVGEGVTLSRLAPLPRRYMVVEGAPSLAARARVEFPTVEVVQALFEEHVPDEPCNKLMALHVLEHVDDPVALRRAPAQLAGAGRRDHRRRPQQALPAPAARRPHGPAAGAGHPQPA